MRERVILFGPLPPPYGGVAIFMKALVDHFREHNIRIWTYGGAKTSDPKIRYIAHRRLKTIPALLAEGKGSQILDASHFHLEYPNPLLLAVWLVLKCVLRFRWYKNVHDGSLPKRYPEFGPVTRWLFHRAVNGVDEFVVVSEQLRRWLREEIKVRQPILVIPALLPTTQEGGTNLPSETIEALRPYLSHEMRVCSIGVFFPSYGFRNVAQAVEDLRKRSGRDIGLLLLDGGFVLDSDYREQVLLDRDWITVLEEIPNREIYGILKRSDVFVRAFRDESYGISRIEALWAGVPVIATRAGETRGMFLYDFGNVEQLTDQLQALLLHPVLEKTDPWAERYRQEATANLQAMAHLLGIQDAGER